MAGDVDRLFPAVVCLGQLGLKCRHEHEDNMDACGQTWWVGVPRLPRLLPCSSPPWRSAGRPCGPQTFPIGFIPHTGFFGQYVFFSLSSYSQPPTVVSLSPHSHYYLSLSPACCTAHSGLVGPTVILHSSHMTAVSPGGWVGGCPSAGGRHLPPHVL